MHASLGRIIAKDTITHNLLLIFGKPTFLTADLGSRLVWRRRKIKVRGDANQSGQCSFECEQPSPAGQAIDAPQMQDAIGQKRGDNRRGLIRDPEEGKSLRQLCGRVPIREV